MKKITAILLMLLMVCTPTYAARVRFVQSQDRVLSVFGGSRETEGFSYADLNGHWCAYTARRLHEERILTGMQIGGQYYFFPDTLITRGEFLMTLMAVLHIGGAPYDSTVFADHSSIADWLKPYAAAAYNAGIIKGDAAQGALYLRPDDKITRIEAICMLYNAVRPEGAEETLPYTDRYLVPAWGEAPVSGLTAYGLLQGYEDGSVRPYVRMNRAMMGELLWQLAQYQAQEKK